MLLVDENGETVAHIILTGGGSIMGVSFPAERAPTVYEIAGEDDEAGAIRAAAVLMEKYWHVPRDSVALLGVRKSGEHRFFEFTIAEHAAAFRMVVHKPTGLILALRRNTHARSEEDSNS